MSLIAGIIAVYLLWVGARRFTQLSPAMAARLLRRFAAALILGIAIVILLRGNIGGAIALGSLAFGVGLWGDNQKLAAAFSTFGIGQRLGRRFARASALTSTWIEIGIDPRTNATIGRVLAGSLRGKDLDALSRAQCLALRRDCLREDPKGAGLLETYLDGRFAGWRQADERERDAGRGGRARGDAMTRDEAYKVLGLSQGASPEEIMSAYRALMKTLHPDRGGVNARAVQINLAKDILMRHG